MALDPLFIGLLLGNLMKKKEDVARRPAEVIFPSGVPSTPATPPTTSTPAAPFPAPALPPAPAPTFPTNVNPPPPTQPTQAADPGFKKAVEVWQVQPELAAQGAVLVGALAQMTVELAKSKFPMGWKAATSVSPAERDMAIALTKQWKDGGVVFTGTTLQAIRAFRMTKHPKTAAAPTVPVHVPAPAPPPATVPASVQPPAPPPFVPPAAAPSAPPGPPPFVPEGSPPAPVAPGLQIATVRPGEGLANVAARLGRPATQVSASEIREVNVPKGPDGVTWQKTNFTDTATRGMKKLNRKGGLQPGDRLFVPPQWGLFDPGLL